MVYDFELLVKLYGAKAMGGGSGKMGSKYNILK